MMGHIVAAFGSLTKDFQYATRALMRDRSLIALVLLTLAVCISANVTVVSILNAICFKPLPYPSAHELVELREGTINSQEEGDVSYPNFEDWKARNHVFSHMAAYTSRSFNVRLGSISEHVEGAAVSSNLLALLKAEPQFGRQFAQDARSRIEEPHVVLMGHRLCVHLFVDCDASVLGKSIIVNEEQHTIVGVMPEH